MSTDNRDHYNAKYRERNSFRYREWLYASYITSLISFCGLQHGSSILDVGCGQGFFSYLFHKCGMKVHGIDISEAGIRMAQSSYGHLGIKFEVADIHAAAFPVKFDCIFVRSCSLYNTGRFAISDGETRTLFRYLKERGVFIFAYNSSMSSKTSPTWRHHSLSDVAEHFRGFPDAKIFFSTKIDTWLVRRYAFNAFVTRLNMLLSKVSGKGGDLICILKNPLEESLQRNANNKRVVSSDFKRLGGPRDKLSIESSNG